MLVAVGVQEIFSPQPVEQRLVERLPFGWPIRVCNQDRETNLLREANAVEHVLNKEIEIGCLFWNQFKLIGWSCTNERLL